jgi:SAM-dependent methyltransferase
MAHKEQIEFCNQVKNMHPENFVNKVVLDAGSLDINGNNRYLFDNCDYIGCDLALGKNVDIACPVHELLFRDGFFDTIISTNMLEHDSKYCKTLNKIAQLLKSNGLFFFSCATTGHREHGTKNTTPMDSPFTNDYYKNITEEDIRGCVDVDNIFSKYEFKINEISHDLYFWGIK